METFDNYPLFIEETTITVDASEFTQINTQTGDELFAYLQFTNNNTAINTVKNKNKLCSKNNNEPYLLYSFYIIILLIIVLTVIKTLDGLKTA